MIKLEAHRPNQFMRICNMKAIVEGFNRYIEEKRLKKNIITNGHIVPQLTITPNATMKAYKTYKIELWFVKDNNKHRVAVVQQVARVVDNMDSIILNVLEIELAKALFSIVESDKMEDMINGEFSDSNE